MLKALSLLFLCCACVTGDLWRWVRTYTCPHPSGRAQPHPIFQYEPRSKSTVSGPRRPTNFYKWKSSATLKKVITLSSELKDFVDQRSQGVRSWMQSKKPSRSKSWRRA